MSRVDRTVATIKEDWPHAAHAGTYHLLFERHDVATDIRDAPDGPPVYVEGGVIAGSYTYRPDSSVNLTEEEYQAVCAALDAPAEGLAEDEPATVPADLTSEARRRNALRYRAEHGHG